MDPPLFPCSGLNTAVEPLVVSILPLIGMVDDCGRIIPLEIPLGSLFKSFGLVGVKTD